MDKDTISYDDAIGTVLVSLAPLLQKEDDGPPLISVRQTPPTP